VALAGTFGRWFWRKRLLRSRRQGDLGITKYGSDSRRGSGAHQPVLVAVANAHQAQPIKLAQERGPLQLAIGSRREIVETFHQEKAKKRMPADGGVRCMKGARACRATVPWRTSVRSAAGADIAAPPVMA
jgi:hypothetical protein